MTLGSASSKPDADIYLAMLDAPIWYVAHDADKAGDLAAYSFVVVGVSQVVGSLFAGSVARAFGVSFAIGGAAAVMLGYAYVAFYRRPELRAL